MENKKNYLTTVLLAWLLPLIGLNGIHRFYTGHIGIGVAQLLTFGGCGIWQLIDFILLCFGNFKDSEGKELEGYSKTTGLTCFFIWLGLAVCVLILYFLLAVIGFAATSSGM